jgi:hypothetical protein
MFQNPLHNGRHSGKWTTTLCCLAFLASMGGMLGFYGLHVSAQEHKRPSLVPASAQSETYSPREGQDVPKPPTDRAEDTADAIDRFVSQKQGFSDATDSRIYERLQVIAACQENLDALTQGVVSGGLIGLKRHIRETAPQIRHLKRVMEDNRYKIALLATTKDNLQRRIIQLTHHSRNPEAQS